MNKLQNLASDAMFDNFVLKHKYINTIFQNLLKCVTWFGFVILYPLSYHYADTLDFGYTSAFIGTHMLLNFCCALLIAVLITQLSCYLLCFLYGFIIVADHIKNLLKTNIRHK